MGNNGWLIVETLASTLSIACFNSFGIATTKYASAAQRSTIDTSRTVLIWILSASTGLQPYWEWQSVFGFILLASGTLIFNEIVVVPYCGMDQNTAEAIAKRKKQDSEAATTENYVSLSPHAAYDAQRNQRGLAKPENINVTKD